MSHFTLSVVKKRQDIGFDILCLKKTQGEYCYGFEKYKSWKHCKN